ncbi:flavin reductase family protein [Haloimpatiens lingqiaonensis]|uniref:flavin reductase family protein n=1 Tax=Haloimpatiens lingqiaonensis TaxID=1380675 RepID=UPI0010FE1FEF|nr:flavin reductase [Haloimpatiens lingqiaonensis]
MESNYTLNLEEALKKLQHKGAFLTVRDRDENTNTMTIGWGNIGYEWGRPVFIVLVRESRHTHKLLENAEDFTVSIPMDDSMKKSMGFCGSKSGRDYDKFKECNLIMKESNKVKSPSIENCGMIYECKIIYKHKMDINLLDEDIKSKWYKEEDSKWYTPGDVHTIYYGEILDCYNNK